MQDQYDIVIVGGRCAGSAAAIGLGRAGYRVLLVERQKMPSDTLSTHVLWPDGIGALRRLGVLERVLATGAPPARHFRLCHGDEVVTTALIPYDGVDYFLCVRRHDLDGILFDAAAATPGVDVFDRTRLVALRHDNGRVVGARLTTSDGERDVSASLVIGADGRDSTVARLVGSMEQDVVEPGRYWYYAYFSGAQEADPPALTESDTETDMVASMMTGAGLRMVIFGAFNEDFQDFRQDHRASFLTRVLAHPCIAELMAGARLASQVYGMAGVRGFYRQACGPGWVLVGDAAHQKNPIVARGINDALLGAEDLTTALAAGISAEGLGHYSRQLRERTRTTARMARLLERPDRHMSAAQGTVLTSAVATPQGLAQVVGLEYGVTRFEDLFGVAAES